jgi:2-succinyl-5-enolpyruvyl-6-hydroxy-3-cyclohexene-1-carboxylate synthase
VSNLHIVWARLFVSALADAGVRRAVVSPGSRSTPLVLAIVEEARLSTHVVVDERSAGFFALGQARASGEPTLLVCTSGTAGAHYFPAIIEASAAHLPLIVVTADRPWEAYDAASPQTIDQVKMFGAFVRHYAELGLPDASALRAVPRIAAQAAVRALGPDPGPVHVNARFRKPLEPITSSESWDVPPTPRIHAPAALQLAFPEKLRARRGLIVCGPAPAFGDLEARRSAVCALGRKTGFPILAEATSQIRFGAGRVFGAFDAVLRDPAARARFRADLIVEIGAPPTSSAYAAYLSEHPPERRIVVAAHGYGDPVGGATDIVCADPVDACRALAEAMLPISSDFSRELESAEAEVWRRVAEEFESGALTEGRVAHEVLSVLPGGANLVVSNSGPVRDLDTYVLPTHRAIRVLSQRGASGIDGLVSGAAGARTVLDGPMALYLGDLAILHDIGGLAAARAAQGPLAIVVVNNAGGRIFEALPIAKKTSAETLERFFVTPERIDLARAAAAFGLAYVAARTPAELSSALKDAIALPSPVLVEAFVDHGAAARRNRIWRIA